MELIVELKSFNNISKLKSYKSVRYFLIGIENISLSACKNFQRDELDDIIKEVEKRKIGLILNAERLFNNEELANAIHLLNEIGLAHFNMITYSDFGFYKALKDLGYSHLVYKAPTYLTNTSDVNLYLSLNENIILSNELSYLELVEISKNLKKEVLIDLVSPNQIFYSRRKLLSTFFKYRNLDKDPLKKNYTIIEELRTKKQKIVEDETGTHIFEDKMCYLDEELDLMANLKYGIIHANFITNKNLYDLVEYYDTLIGSHERLNVKESFHQLLSKGMYENKTILKKEGAVK